jgi:hypothetical protein
MSDNAFARVCKIEHPLGATKRLADALALITETIDEPEASAMNEIVHTMLRHLADIDTEYSFLFRLHHPNRDHFEKQGWPDKLDDHSDAD